MARKSRALLRRGSADVPGRRLGSVRRRARHEPLRPPHPPITFHQYVAFLFGAKLQLVWVASTLLLGLGGLVRESALGTASFTLALPFRRSDWTRTRAALGVAQAAVIALIPALTIPAVSPLAGFQYPAWEAFKYSGLLFAAGAVFFFVGVFWSAVLSGEFTAVLAAAVSALLAFTAQDYLYYWFPSFMTPGFNLHAFLGGYDHVNRATGFLTNWPWPGIIKSLSVACGLYWASTEIIRRRDF